MKLNTVRKAKNGKQQEPSRLDLLQRVLLHNTSINTTLLKLMWDQYTSASNASTRKGTTFTRS